MSQPRSAAKTPTAANPFLRLRGIASFLWKATGGYRLRPWASPYLRWRIETYWGWPAETIDARRFWSFSWRRRADLLRFLLWAGEMDAAARRRSR